MTALITTCYREAASISAFIDAILAQTLNPDEIVIVDAGSDDGTVAEIEARIAGGAPIRLIVEPGCNRSQGRNRAIAATSADIVAVTDVGAVPRPEWFERITAPLTAGGAEYEAAATAADDVSGPAHDRPRGSDTARLLRKRPYSAPPECGPEAAHSALPDVVAGYYVADPRTTWEAAVAAATVPDVSEVDPDTFLPSSRSVAFRRKAWERAGGYPEWAWHNEDTPFDLALKASGARFVFEPEALVAWRPQGSVRRLFVQFWRYARGDAQARIWFRHYTKAYAVAAATVGLVVAGALWRPAWLGLAALTALYWGRHFLKARRRTKRLAAALLAPLANAIVDVAHVAGYARGVGERSEGAGRG